MDLPATERLWITEPRRTTALARVVAVRGAAFALDRSLFAPTSRTHRHPQPHDQGTVWGEGEKRWLMRVEERDGALWHRLKGMLPPIGTELNCHLDAERRAQVSRTHTAMHLLLAALRPHRAALTADPKVKLGGTFRLDLAAPLAPRALAEALARANAWAAEDRRVTREHLPRGTEAKLLDAQAFQPPDPYPGPAATLDAVRIEGVCAYPCDGTHVERTRKVGRIVIPVARAAHGGAVIVAKVAG